MIRWQQPEGASLFELAPWSNLRSEINRLFDHSLENGSPFPRLMGAWGPALDMGEDKENYWVRVEIPGMKKEEIEVSIEDGMLVISGERKASESYKKAHVHRAERFHGRFSRSVALPAPVNTEKVKAAYSDGVLTVTLPKTEAAKPKVIEVKVG